MSTTSGGVSSSSQQYQLALNILGEHFGPLVRVSQAHPRAAVGEDDDCKQTDDLLLASIHPSIDCVLATQDVGGYLLRRGQATLMDVRRFLEGESEHRGVKLSQVGTEGTNKTRPHELWGGWVPWSNLSNNHLLYIGEGGAGGAPPAQPPPRGDAHGRRAAAGAPARLRILRGAFPL